MQKERARFSKPLFFQNVFIASFFFWGFFVKAQENNLTVSYSNTPLSEVIADIESKSGYRFFYINDWLGDKSSSLSLANDNLTNVLEAVFADTNLNYYVLEDEKRIILLQNTIVYDELPNNFFGRKDSIANTTTELTSNRPPPTFFTESATKTNRKYSLVRIGKSDPNNLRPSYTLTGKATNARTGEAIQDLAIRLRGINGAVITDEDGNYNIEVPTGYNVLMASAMGIQDMEREIAVFNNGSLNLVMEEGLEQLDEVVVEADAISNVEETSTGTETIDLEESKNIPLVLGERDLLQVAKALPGISSAGEGATGLNVRGGKTDQNLVLLDDAVIYSPTHFFGIFQALNPFTTKGADIYKGSIPVEFGGRLSSVFDIRTKNGNVEKFSGEGSIGPVTGNLALEIPIKKDTSSLVIGGRGAYADWILRSLDEESLNNSEASFFDVIAKYHHRFNLFWV